VPEWFHVQQNFPKYPSLVDHMSWRSTGCGPAHEGHRISGRKVRNARAELVLGKRSSDELEDGYESGKVFVVLERPMQFLSDRSNGEVIQDNITFGVGVILGFGHLFFFAREFNVLRIAELKNGPRKGSPLVAGG
jgi:hypothetical protein